MDADNCILFKQHFVLYVTFFFLSFKLISIWLAFSSISLSLLSHRPTNIPNDPAHIALAYIKLFAIRYTTNRERKKKNSTFLALQFNGLPFDFLFPYFLLFFFCIGNSHCSLSSEFILACIMPSMQTLEKDRETKKSNQPLTLFWRKIANI